MFCSYRNRGLCSARTQSEPFDTSRSQLCFQNCSYQKWTEMIGKNPSPSLGMVIVHKQFLNFNQFTKIKQELRKGANCIIFHSYHNIEKLSIYTTTKAWLLISSSTYNKQQIQFPLSSPIDVTEEKTAFSPIVSSFSMTTPNLALQIDVLYKIKLHTCLFQGLEIKLGFPFRPHLRTQLQHVTANAVLSEAVRYSRVGSYADRSNQPNFQLQALFNCNEFNTGYWSWNYPATGTRLAPSNKLIF